MIASAISTSQPEPLLLSRLEERLLKLIRPIRPSISPGRESTPAKTAATTASRASPLRICVSSCASTPRSSRLSSAFSSPRVTVTAPVFRDRPEAKAFSASLSITARRGIGSPRLMQSSSSVFQRKGSSFRVTGFAPVRKSRMRWFADQAIANQMPVTTSTTGTT